MGRVWILVLVVGGVVALGMLAALTAAVERSQSRARDDAIKRFDDRGELAAQLLAGSFAQAATRQAADAQVRLSGPATAAALRAWEGESDPLIPYTALYDSRGRLLALHPPTARPLRTADGRAALRAATKGQPGTSGVTSSSRGPAIESFVPFPAGDEGLRVLLIGFPAEVTAQFAAGALKDAAGTPSGGAFVVDRAGTQVTATGAGSKAEGAAEAVASAARDGRADGSVDGSRFVVRRAAGSGLLVGLVAPEAELAAGLPSTLWPRLALGGFGLALLVVLWLAGRSLRDARRLDAARHDAETANRAKTAFVASVSHEVRTPLNTISGAAQILAGDDEAKPFSRELAEDIRSSARHLNEMLTDLIDISAIEQGLLRLTPAPVDVGEICDEVAGTARPLAAARDLTIEVAYDPGLDEVVTDPARLRQALYNYVHNAVKFSPPGGRITVSAQREKSDAFRVEVANPGPPISPANQERLFTEFEQLDASQPGTGLGLAVTRRIVEAQGGSVGVSSAEGDDIRFWLRLPLRAAVREPVAAR